METRQEEQITCGPLAAWIPTLNDEHRYGGVLVEYAQDMAAQGRYVRLATNPCSQPWETPKVVAVIGWMPVEDPEGILDGWGTCLCTDGTTVECGGVWNGGSTYH